MSRHGRVWSLLRACVPPRAVSRPAWRLHHGDGGSSSAREPHGAAVEPMQSMHSGDLGPELRPHCKGGKVEKSVLSRLGGASARARHFASGNP